MEKQQVTVISRRANQIRNLGKEISERMHLAKAILIDQDLKKSRNNAAAKAERLARKS